MKRLTLLAQLSTEAMQMPLDFLTNHQGKTMLTKFLALIRTSLFLSIILPSTQAIAEYDIDGEWSFTNGISGAAARIRFNTVGTLAVAKLEIAGRGYANDFILVGESSNNVIPSLCGDNEFISLCISINFESNSSANATQNSCSALPNVEAECSNPNGTTFLIERPQKLNLSGIWYLGLDEYFSVTHGSDGAATVDPVLVDGGKIYEGEVYTGNISIIDGSGSISGPDGRGGVKEFAFISATDTEAKFKTTSCSGECSGSEDLIDVVRTIVRVGESPKYSR
ncbi:hypothetical protein N8373_00215 [Gammaproteobacteria bacterium]|nr:hypothetical protein [Gammaproteobacteria bacterium]